MPKPANQAMHAVEVSEADIRAALTLLRAMHPEDAVEQERVLTARARLNSALDGLSQARTHLRPIMG